MANTTGPELAAIRKELGATAAALAAAMGYTGTSAHARVFQIEALASVSDRMVTRYLDGIARLRRQAEEEVA